MRRWKDEIDYRTCDRMVAKSLENPRYARNSDEEREAFGTAKAEEEGRLEAAKAGWARLAQMGDPRWASYGEARLEALNAVEARARQWEIKRDGVRKTTLEPPDLAGLDREGFLAYRYERFGDLKEARDRYEAVRKKADSRDWQVLALGRVTALDDEIKRKGGKVEVKPLIEKKLADAEEALKLDPKNDKKDEERIYDARLDCYEVEALYAKDDSLKDLRTQAADLKKQLDKKLGY
jgi:hypothetical protein